MKEEEDIEMDVEEKKELENDGFIVVEKKNKKKRKHK